MRVIEHNNKIVLAELDPNCDYIMLCNPDLVRYEDIKNIQVRSDVNISIVSAFDVDKAVRFVEVPKKP